MGHKAPGCPPFFGCSVHRVYTVGNANTYTRPRGNTYSRLHAGARYGDTSLQHSASLGERPRAHSSEDECGKRPRPLVTVRYRAHHSYSTAAAKEGPVKAPARNGVPVGGTPTVGYAGLTASHASQVLL